jgi:hypothetical protein
LRSITSFVNIANGKIGHNGNRVWESADAVFTEFADKWYRHHAVSYPKFHKMDSLCKLGFMGAETLLTGRKIASEYAPYDIGVILSNRSSSLETDLHHHRQVQAGLASPAVFVYSLPNIVIGEICIRHGIKGENTFFIEPEFDASKQLEYINVLFQSGIIRACIGGWVEFLNGEYRLFMYLAEQLQEPSLHPLNTETLTTLYQLS